MSKKSLFQKANSPEEILDLVDKNDQIIGEVVRKEANADPSLLHREVGIVIVDTEQRILLQKRSAYKTVNPQMWSICAGHIEKGGDPETTAHRELLEEYGFDTQLTFLQKELHSYPHETHFAYLYVGKYTDQAIQVEPAEIEMVKFVSKEQLDSMIKAGEKINDHYFKAFEKIWENKIQ